MVLERDREERKNNIIIKKYDIDVGIEITKERIEKSIKKKLGMETKVLRCRRSGREAIVRLENRKKKKEVTVNKNKLKRCSAIYMYIKKRI